MFKFETELFFQFTNNRLIPMWIVLRTDQIINFYNGFENDLQDNVSFGIPEPSLDVLPYLYVFAN